MQMQGTAAASASIVSGNPWSVIVSWLLGLPLQVRRQRLDALAELRGRLDPTWISGVQLASWFLPRILLCPPIP